MPSFQHEFLIDLLRQDPTVLLTLLRHAAGFSPPPFQEIRPGETDLTQVVPIEYRADLTLVFYSAGKPVYGKIIEVQFGKDAQKKRSWPSYWAVARARLGSPVGVVVIAMDEDVAAWARQPIADGNLGGGHLTPYVLGPREIPWITDGQLAEGAPELVMMSLLGHAQEPGLEPVAQAALQSVDKLEGERRKLYYDVITLVLREACRRGLLEKKIMEGLLAKYQDHLKGLHAELAAEAKAELKAEAKAEAKADDLLEVIEARGLGASEEVRLRVRSCTDLERLGLWFKRALRAATIDEVFA